MHLAEYIQPACEGSAALHQSKHHDGTVLISTGIPVIEDARPFHHSGKTITPEVSVMQTLRRGVAP